MKRRHFMHLAAAAVILAAAAVILAACGRKTALPTIPSGASVLAFGDSVTHGTGAGRGEDWPNLLAQRTGWQIINAGIPGDTAEAARQRLQAALDEHRPALVIVELGGNDFLRRRPAGQVKEDLRQIVRAARQTGASVVLVAVPELSLLGVLTRKPADSPIYRELGEEEGVAVITDVFSDILGQPELRADQIHPNAAGYREMAAGLHAALQRLGLARPA